MNATGFRFDVPTQDEVFGSAAREHNVLQRVGSLGASGGFVDAPLWPLLQRGESCTGHFLARGLFWMLGERFSPYFPWLWGRVHDFGIESLFDIGVSSRSMLAAAEEHGMCPFDSYQPRGAELHELPPAMARAQAQGVKVDVEPIFASGDRLVDRLCDSLSLGQACGLVVEVDDAFRNPVDGAVGPPAGPSRGLHIVGLKHFETIGSRRYIWHEGSWGRSYGVKGGAFLHPDRVGAAPYACFIRSAEILS